MYFLLRLTFWFSIVLLMLPFGEQSARDKEATSGSLEAASAARDAIENVAEACSRQPDLCTAGKAALGLLAEEADTPRTALRALAPFLDGTDDQRTGAIPVPTPRPDYPSP